MVDQAVTILVYTFPVPGREDDAFARIAASIERAWKHCGELKPLRGVVCATKGWRTSLLRFSDSGQDVT